MEFHFLSWFLLKNSCMLHKMLKGCYENFHNLANLTCLNQNHLTKKCRSKKAFDVRHHLIEDYLSWLTSFNTCLLAPGAIAHHLQCSPACNSQNGWWSVERCLPLKSHQLLINKFFDLSTPIVRKVHEGGNKTDHRKTPPIMCMFLHNKHQKTYQ